MEEIKRFMFKVVQQSGLSQTGTYLPAGINPMLTTAPKYDVDACMEEAEMVMGGAVQELLDRTGVRPAQVDILVTNCSIFSATPSLASMLINKFKFRTDVQSYHLGGMGCSNGVIGIGLMRDLLQARRNSVALFVPAEVTSAAYYHGLHKHYMISNCIFRMGGAAVLLSNKPQHARVAKYQLHCNVRVHTGQSDESYRCVTYGPDPDGANGVYLDKKIVAAAGAALESCLRRLLTWGQLLEASVNYVGRASGLVDWKAWRPSFSRSVEHFAIHAGGYAVLKGIQKGMDLPVDAVLPSFAALRDYGNTSCSTTWYSMAYIETCGKITKGQTVMQVGVGGGMKGGINIWRALRNNHTTHPAWVHLANSPITEADLPRSIQAAPIPVDSKPSSVPSKAQAPLGAVEDSEASSGLPGGGAAVAVVGVSAVVPAAGVEGDDANGAEFML
ncbi:FAE1/Type III polyketide synthase-like protein-domain-containing protein [Scenedesmus sp. NREL 46B-D3]|nr:FAE1/Type III polyketide synthase-like protein-domain-containing protein [Scenedesmus sp. NREL 46B-D3]